MQFSRIRKCSCTGKSSLTISAKPGWSCGCAAAVDCRGRTSWVADAHRDDGERFVVRAEEKLTAFVELEAMIVRKLIHRNLEGGLDVFLF
jgi:hypothetical protein